MSDAHFAVVVGIDRYTRLNKLKHAREDAVKFRDWLVKPDGGNLDPNNVQLITHEVGLKDEAAAQPLRLEVKDALVEMKRRADAIYAAQGGTARWRRSRLYFYVSGHGVASNLSDTSLLMANAGDAYWDEGVSCDHVLNHLTAREQSFAEVVVFADCCRQLSDVPVQPLFLPGGRNDRLGDRLPWALFHATQFGTAALEPNEDGDHLRGYFTDALLEGLGGDAAPKGTPITCVNLKDFLVRRVYELSGSKQLPSCRFGPDLPPANGAAATGPRPLELVPKSAGPDPYKITLKFLTCNAQVQLFGGRNERLHRRTFKATPNAEWAMRLQPGLYRVLDTDGKLIPGLKNDGMFAYSGEKNHVQEI